MNRVDIKLGWNCNNYCLFCVQGDKRYKYKPRSLEYIKKQLLNEYKKGRKEVVFTGGEPTMYNNLLEAIKYAKNIGYKDIQIQSNGQNFSDINYLKELIKNGASEFSPSIHGFFPETHNKLVDTSDARGKVVKGIKNLKKLNQRIIVNTVVTELNYKELPKLAWLLSYLKVTQFQFAFVHILGNAYKNKNSIVPKKTKAIPYIHKALDIGKNNNIKCMTEAIPFCFMKDYEWAIAEYNYMPETTIIDAETKTESYSNYRINEGKIKGEKCNKCKLNNICEGPWKEYIDIYGWEEFQPILN